MEIFNLLQILTLLHRMKYGLGGGPCIYYVDGPSSANLEKPTDTIGDKSFSVLTIKSIDGGDIVTDINVKEQDGSSAYFEVLNNEVFVKSCPPVGESQPIQTILMDKNLQPLDPTCAFRFSVTVVPSVPDILVVKNTSVLVSSLDDDLEVLDFDFANTNNCTNFICAVRCTNDKKAFWIDDVNMIRTSPYNITYGFLYDLDLTCYESSPRKNETNSAMVQVIFRRMTTSGNSAESSIFSRSYVGIVCCLAYFSA